MLDSTAVELTDQVRHFLLDRRTGRRAMILDRLEESPCADGLRLVALPSNGRPLVDDAGTFGGLVAPTGVAVDAEGRIYLVDRADKSIRRFDPCCAAFDRLPCIGGDGDELRRFTDPQGIVVSRDGFLYVVDAGARRVQAFSLKGLALTGVWGPIDGHGQAISSTPELDPNRPDLCPPARVFPAGTWQPWGIALAHGGGAYVTDRANGLVHSFDRFGDWKWARDGSAPDNPALVSPTHIAIDCEGRLYVVQEGILYIAVFDQDAKFLGRADPPERLAPAFRPGPLVAGPDGHLYVINQAAPQVEKYCCPAAPGAPVTFVAGSCGLPQQAGGIAFDADGDPLLTLPAAAQVIHLEGDRAFAVWGRYFTEALDSHRRACQWHRIVLKGVLPVGAQVTVETVTSEAVWEDSDLLSLPEDAWAGGQAWTGTPTPDWDCLVMSPPGRYLWLRLTITGPGTDTPLLGAVKVYYPRRTSAERLPAVYRAGPDADFVDRFMSIFDSVGDRVDHVLDDFVAYLEPAATPNLPAPPSPTAGGGGGTDFLTWLASWLGLAFDGTWTEATGRRLLANAAWLYARRGTIPGLIRAIQIVMGVEGEECDRLTVTGVLEEFKLRRWALLGGSALGDQTMLWGRKVVDRLEIGENSTIGSFRITDLGDPVRDPFHVYAHRFTVFFPAACATDDASRRAVDRMIQLAKPAHTIHQLEFVEPRLRIGIQATIGLDTAIGRYPESTQTGVSMIGRDSVLGEPPGRPATPNFQVGVRSLIGSAVL
jgi:phage tail-like protein